MLNRVLYTGFLYLYAILEVCVIFCDAKDKGLAIGTERPYNEVANCDNLVLRRWGVKFDHLAN